MFEKSFEFENIALHLFFSTKIVFSLEKEMARANPFEYYSFEFNEFLTGYHVYKSTWLPFVNEQVFGEVEFDNDHYPNAVKHIRTVKSLVTYHGCLRRQ